MTRAKHVTKNLLSILFGLAVYASYTPAHASVYSEIQKRFYSAGVIDLPTIADFLVETPTCVGLSEDEPLPKEMPFKFVSIKTTPQLEPVFGKSLERIYSPYEVNLSETPEVALAFEQEINSGSLEVRYNHGTHKTISLYRISDKILFFYLSHLQCEEGSDDCNYGDQEAITYSTFGYCFHK